MMELNHRPRHYQCRALTPELIARVVNAFGQPKDVPKGYGKSTENDPEGQDSSIKPIAKHVNRFFGSRLTFPPIPRIAGA